MLLSYKNTIRSSIQPTINVKCVSFMLKVWNTINCS